jgi:hypothetical protein
MSWIKIDDRLPQHPKIGGLTDAAFRAYVEGLCYANAYLTDGYLPLVFHRSVKPAARRQLVEHDLWEPSGDGYVIHDYLEHQRSSDAVRATRDADAERARRWRSQRQRNGVTPPFVTPLLARESRRE